MQRHSIFELLSSFSVCACVVLADASCGSPAPPRAPVAEVSVNQAPEPPPDRPSTLSVAAPGANSKDPAADLVVRESIDAEPSFAGAKLGAPKASFKNLREENREIKSATPVNEAGLAFSDSTYTFRDGSLDFAKFTGHDAALCTKTGVHLKRRLGEPSKHSTDGSEQSYWRGRHARLVFGSQGNVCTVLLFDDQSLMNKMVAP